MQMWLKLAAAEEAVDRRVASHMQPMIESQDERLEEFEQMLLDVRTADERRGSTPTKGAPSDMSSQPLTETGFGLLKLLNMEAISLKCVVGQRNWTNQ